MYSVKCKQEINDAYQTGGSLGDLKIVKIKALRSAGVVDGIEGIAALKDAKDFSEGSTTIKVDEAGLKALQKIIPPVYLDVVDETPISEKPFNFKAFVAASAWYATLDLNEKEHVDVLTDALKRLDNGKEI